MSEHQIIVNLSGDALRTALDRADAAGFSLSDLFEAMLLADGERDDRRPGVDYPVTADVLSPSMPELLSAPEGARGQLPFLTNRLSPIKVAAKALTELAGKEGGWPAIGDFQRQAGSKARSLGLRLRSEDQNAGRRGASRRWTGYPVGDDEGAARERFVASFAADSRDGRLRGPLVVLGLAALTGDGRVALTGDGFELAGALSPLTHAGERTLSADEIEIFARRLRAATDEAMAIGEFLGSVRHVAGVQTNLDALLATRHPDWSANRASAERAAMLGRLGELGVLEVEGRGSRAKIKLLDTMGFEQ